MRPVVCAWIALDIYPMLVSVFDTISKYGFSFRIGCIRRQIFVCRQPSVRRPGVLPTTQYV